MCAQDLKKKQGFEIQSFCYKNVVFWGFVSTSITELFNSVQFAHIA